MTDHLREIVAIEIIMSPSEIGNVRLQPIVDAIIETSSPLNVLNMLRLSCEYDSHAAQATYLSIISECSKVFEPYVLEIASQRLNFRGAAVYYYFEFILACCSEDLYASLVDGIDVCEDDLAYHYFIKLKRS